MLTDNLDILLINIPISGLQYPPAGTSQLKGSVVDAGFTCTILDLNLDLFNKTGSDYSKFFDYFSEATHGDPEIDARVDQILDSWVDDIIKINPRFVGISVFTMMCQLATRMFTKKLKQKYTGKIVIGGAGISTNGIASAYNDFGAEMREFGIEGESVAYNHDKWLQVDGLVNLLAQAYGWHERFSHEPYSDAVVTINEEPPF